MAQIVGAGDVTHASGSRFALRGRAVSSWARVAAAAVVVGGGTGVAGSHGAAAPTFVHNITIPTAALVAAKALAVKGLILKALADRRGG